MSYRSSANHKQQNNKPADLTLDWSYNDFVHHTNTYTDDDSVTHHFHYERFSKNRNKMLFSILFKIVLVITHISSLLFASFHLLH